MVMRAATASWASGPAAETVTCWPLVAPRPITPSTLLASAVWLPAVTDTAEAPSAAAHRGGDPAARHGERPGRAGVQVAGQGDDLLTACGHDVPPRPRRR